MNRNFLIKNIVTIKNLFNLMTENKEWNTKLLGGSVKRNIVNPDMQEERDKCNFNKTELAEFIISKQTIDEMTVLKEEIEKDSRLQTGLDFLEMSREEQ